MLEGLARQLQHCDIGLFIIVGASPRKALRKIRKEIGRDFSLFYPATLDELIAILDSPPTPTALDLTLASREQASIILAAMNLRVPELLEHSPGGLLLFLSEANEGAVREVAGNLYARRTTVLREEAVERPARPFPSRKKKAPRDNDCD